MFVLFSALSLVPKTVPNVHIPPPPKRLKGGLTTTYMMESLMLYLEQLWGRRGPLLDGTYFFG